MQEVWENSLPQAQTLISRLLGMTSPLEMDQILYTIKHRNKAACNQAPTTNELNVHQYHRCRHGYTVNLCMATASRARNTTFRPTTCKRNNQNGQTMGPHLACIALVFLLAANFATAQLTSSNGAQTSRYRLAGYSQFNANSNNNVRPNQQPSMSPQPAGNPAIVPAQVWARSGLLPVSANSSDEDNNLDEQPSTTGANRRANVLALNRLTAVGNGPNNGNMMKSVRHIVTGSTAGSPMQRSDAGATNEAAVSDDICADRLCYGLPMGCATSGAANSAPADQQVAGSSPSCSVLVTSKRHIDPDRPISRDILFEMIALPLPGTGTYAAVGFSENGRMQGLASECLHYRDAKTQLELIKLKHSYNVPGAYSNVPVTIISGIKELGVAFENGKYQCRWIVESAVEYSFEAANGSLITRRDDLGYKNYHILLASGDYDDLTEAKGPHTLRSSSLVPVSLAQTGHIKSLGAHILIRIHGSLMIAIWIGFVTLSIVLARYYKNEWSNSKLSDLAIWFVAHRALMLIAWFGTVIAIIFAYMYTETYHPGLHQLSGTTCLLLSTIQVLGGLFRPSQESSKRTYFNWAHFICGNLSYLCAMICLVTAAFLAPAHLPPLYIWVIVIFVATYALTHAMLTTHQYITHKSSKISITPMSDLNSNSSTTYTSCGFVADSYPKEVNSPFRQFLLGILVTIIVIFIVLLISLVNIK